MFLSILNLVLIFSPMGNNNDTHSIIIFNLYMESATSGYVASLQLHCGSLVPKLLPEFLQTTKMWSF